MYNQETHLLALALFDFVPVSFFLIGAYFLAGISTRMCGVRCGRLAMFGALLIFMGGFSKAVWKLLHTIEAGNFQLLSDLQFILLAPGFLALLVVVVFMARSERIEYRTAILMLAIAPWKIPFLIVMTLASMGVQGILAHVSFRRNAKPAAAGFVVAFVCLVGMGAMASGEQTLAMQWLEQSVNTVGQMGFMIGAILLYRNINKSQAHR